MGRLFTIAMLVCVSYASDAQWVQVAGPKVCAVHCLTLSGTNLFAGTGDGVFLSSNSGISWTPSLTETPVLCLAISGVHLFAGTHTGVYHSSDNGATWVKVGLGGKDIRALAVSGPGIFAATTYFYGGIFLTTNNGVSWTQVNSGLTNMTVRALVASGGNLFAGTEGYGVFLSTNNGTNWTAVNAGLTDASVTALAVSGTNLFAGTYYGGVFLSTDNGASWVSLGSGLDSASVTSFAMDGDSVYVGTDKGVYGLWSGWVNDGLPDIHIGALAVSGATLFAGTLFSGAFSSTNGGARWAGINDGLTHPPIVSVVATSGSNLVVGTDTYGIFTSTDDGGRWIATGVATWVQGYVYSLAASNGRLYAGTLGRWWDGAFLSTDNGISWDLIGGGGTVAAHGDRVLAGTWFCLPGGCAGELFLSTDGGTGWDSANFGYALELPCLAVTDTFLFSGFPGIWHPGGIFRSSGKVWEPANSGLTNTMVMSLFVNGKTLFAGTGNGPHLSTNNGTNWIPANSGLEGTTIASFTATLDGIDLFAGTFDNGVFLSSNDGTTWNPVNTNLPNGSAGSLATSATTLFAAIDSSGIWRRQLSEMITDVRVQTELPTRFALLQNYPNPFNPSTTIKYQIPSTNHVMLKVFDLLGREVATLVNEVKKQGEYAVQFDGSRLASGVYFYRMQAGHFVNVKPLILIK